MADRNPTGAPASRLVATRIPENPDGVVIVLHGGGGRRGAMMVRPTQLSVLRMIPIAWRIARRGKGRLAVFRLLNSTRGWNAEHTPVDDARWAIKQVVERYGAEIPIALVGHSLGGRAALLTAAHAPVNAVVALNPYLHSQDRYADLAGTAVLVVHGTADRVASLATAEAVVHGLRQRADVTLVRVVGGKHAMLSRHRVFDGLASDFVISELLSGYDVPGSAPWPSTGRRSDLPG